MLAMLPRWTSSPRTNPSMWLPGPIASSIASGAALEPSRRAFGKPRRADLLRGAAEVVRHAIESQPRALAIGECIARLVAAIAGLAGGAHDGEPTAVLGRRDRRAGHWTERHGTTVGAHVKELLLVHMAAEHITRVGRSHALARFP